MRRALERILARCLARIPARRLKRWLAVRTAEPEVLACMVHDVLVSSVDDGAFRVEIEAMPLVRPTLHDRLVGKRALHIAVVLEGNVSEESAYRLSAVIAGAIEPDFVAGLEGRKGFAMFADPDHPEHAHVLRAAARARKAFAAVAFSRVKRLRLIVDRRRLSAHEMLSLEERLALMDGD